MVGMSRHGGVLPVGGTFFCFSDYMRGAVRLAALSKTKVIYSWTHDSVGLGQDGPTHQPVEQLAAMRAMPNLLVIRPADANETAQAVKAAIDYDGGPTALILSAVRPSLYWTARSSGPNNLHRGAYVLSGDAAGPDIVLIGTGSEVSVCVERGQSCSRRTGCTSAWCPCRAGNCSSSRGRRTSARSSARAHQPWPSRRRPASAGRAGRMRPCP